MKFSVHKNKVIFFVIFIAVVLYIFAEKPVKKKDWSEQYWKNGSNMKLKPKTS